MVLLRPGIVSVGRGIWGLGEGEDETALVVGCGPIQVDCYAGLFEYGRFYGVMDYWSGPDVAVGWGGIDVCFWW